MTAESLSRALEARRVGAYWMAPCPAHKDSNPSMSIREECGKILLHCHAGCAQRDVIEALKARGLWETPEKTWARRIVATYDYVDPAGKLLFQVLRFEPKDFRQRHPDGNGGWVWRKGEQVLYRVPEVLAATRVFVVEGEKDCESLRARGFVATTNAGGAKAPWLPRFTDALVGREVILLPDADEAGRLRVVTIARALLGKAARIIVIELDGAKDVSEWFERGHSKAELIAQIEGQVVTQ